MSFMSADLIQLARRISRSIPPSKKWKPMKQVEVRSDGVLVFENDRYTATLRHHESGWPLDSKSSWAQIGIHCEDGQPRHDWREFQHIKNDLVGKEWEAIELYPAESRLCDPSNYFILWCAPRIQIGLNKPRLVSTPEDAIAPQRGWL